MATRAEIRFAKVVKQVEEAAERSRREPEFIDDWVAQGWTDTPTDKQRKWARWWICGGAVAVVLLMLFGCVTPMQVAKVRPQIPKDIQLVCHSSGVWAIISESAGEAAIFPKMPACGKGAV